MKYTEYNEDAGRNEFGAHLESESRKYSALQSLLAGKLLEKDEIESLRECKFVGNSWIPQSVMLLKQC